MFCRKKNRVAPAVILQGMGQLEAERRRDEGRNEGRPPVRDAWAPVLADSGTRLRDIRVECEEDDPHRVWRLEAMLENERARVVMLKTMLANEDSKIGIQEGEIESLQEENERLQEENDVQGVQIGEQEGEITRLQEENDTLREISLVKMTTMVVKDLQDKELSVPLCCPITHELFKHPVVSRFGYFFEREAIEKWLWKHRACPLTRHSMTIADLSPNRALADVANAFRAYQVEQEQPVQ